MPLKRIGNFANRDVVTGSINADHQNKTIGFTGRPLATRIAGCFRLSDTRYRGLAAMPEHGHGIPYLSFVVNGSYEEQVGRDRRICAPNDVVTHSEGEVHSVAFSSPETRILRIESSGYFGGDKIPLRDTVLASKRIEDPLFSRIAARIWSELVNWDCFSAIAVEGLLLEMVAYLARAKKRSSGSARSDKVTIAEEYLRTEFAGEINLEKVAEAIGVHPVHLSREFRKRKGVTFGEYLRLVRIRKACSDLAQSDDKLCDIALSAGFCDQSHFSNTFRKVVGITPSEYRRSVRHG